MPFTLDQYKTYFLNKKFLLSFILSFIFLFGSFFVSYYASTYAQERASQPVTDIFLSNIPAVDVDGIFAFGPLVFWGLVAYLLLKEPKRIPYTIKTIALFVLIRAFFISLTHIGPFPVQSYVDYSMNVVKFFGSGSDLFFSGHTGLPFLIALVFWDYKILRCLFIATAVFFGIVVLLGHLHYSIDVLAAFFITYSIYRIAERVFPRDKKIFQEGIESR